MKKKLLECLCQSETIRTILENNQRIDLPNWYIAGGVIPTVVWNTMASNDPECFVKDVDIVYYDKTDLSGAAEERQRRRFKRRFPDLTRAIDLVNQARVHTWYRDKRRQPIQPYQSVEDAIDKWLSVTAIGVRRDERGDILYAPFGLDDLFSMRVRPNRQIISESYYKEKTARWKKQWPGITVLDY